jgi:hypothetical protein
MVSLSDRIEKRLATVSRAYLLFFNLLSLGGLFLTIKCWWDAVVNVESDSNPRKVSENPIGKVYF